MNIVVDSRYQIVKRLGKGGFAHTYLAKNLTLPKQPHCVIKQLRPKVEHPQMLELFRLEAEILSRLQHSQIPQMVEWFEYQGDFFIVQDFVAGDDLTKEFTIGHQWSEAKVIHFLGEMLEVLGYIHAQQAIHRDIKPANIIRRWHDGKLCPIDFGAAIDLQNKSHLTNPIVGTPGYQAPEQIDGAAIFSSDIYSLGMTAIQFLTGQYPLHLARDENRQLLWRNLTSVSDGLAAILDNAIAFDVRNRYQSTCAVLADLNLLLNRAESFTHSVPPCWHDTSDRHQIGKRIMALLLSLGLLSTVAIVDRSHYPKHHRTIESRLDRENYQEIG
jgi:eukaryotic-like serine/threonine-protein kinase